MALGDVGRWLLLGHGWVHVDEHNDSDRGQQQTKHPLAVAPFHAIFERIHCVPSTAPQRDRRQHNDDILPEVVPRKLIHKRKSISHDLKREG